MPECELLARCPFFNEQMADMPATAQRCKEQYCRGDNSRCARYMVFKALGRECVPSDLFPNEEARARQVIAQAR